MNSENKQRDTDGLNVLDSNYILGACLVQSVTGDIYAAWDAAVDRVSLTSDTFYDYPPQFFIKFLPESFSDSDGIMSIIDNEIQRLTSCFDWSKIVAFEKKSDPAYLVLQLPRGEFFGQQLPLKKAYGDLPTVLSLINKISIALNILQDCGIQHGRVEPDSLFITETGDVGLVDSLYVSAKQRLLEESDHTATVPNKEALYASPDICFGRAVSEQDNVFSLACICYHLLSGVHPFGDNNSVSTLLNKVRPEPIITLSAAQWQHLEYGLSLAQESRIETVSDFIKGFDRNAKPFTPLKKQKNKEIAAAARKNAQKIIEQQKQRKKAARVKKQLKSQQKITKPSVQPSPAKQKKEPVEWAWIPLSLLTGMIVGSLAITFSINAFDMNFFTLIKAVIHLF